MYQVGCRRDTGRNNRSHTLISCSCRRPFIFLGYLICALSYLWLAALYTPSAPSLALLVGLATLGMVMADTICDSLVVER